MNVQRMTREQRSIFIDMMAIAWDSEEPGRITLSEDALCHELRILKRSLRRLLSAFPACWRREDGALVQPKLHDQWLKYQEIQQKRSSALKDKWGSASASAFAFASAIKEEKLLRPNQTLSLIAKEKSIPKLTPSEREFQSDRELEAIKQRQRKALQDKLGIAL